jgi:tripartite ATP-independent transporter DctM subunit
MIFCLPFIAMIVAFLLGVPIAFALAGAGALGIWLVTGDWNIVMGVLGMAPFNSVANYVLTTIPMFIIMAQLSSSSGLANDLYNVASDWLSGLRGGLAIATVFACAIFGAMSGASVAAASVMSKIAMPNMRRFGYSEVLAAGSIGVGSTLDILIPPSVAMVVYGILTETSIGKLLIAGVVPGIVLAILLALVIWVWVTINPSLAPRIAHLWQPPEDPVSIRCLLLILSLGPFTPASQPQPRFWGNAGGGDRSTRPVSPVLGGPEGNAQARL